MPAPAAPSRSPLDSPVADSAPSLVIATGVAQVTVGCHRLLQGRRRVTALHCRVGMVALAASD